MYNVTLLCQAKNVIWGGNVEKVPSIMNRTPINKHFIINMMLLISFYTVFQIGDLPISFQISILGKTLYCNIYYFIILTVCTCMCVYACMYAWIFCTRVDNWKKSSHLLCYIFQGLPMISLGSVYISPTLCRNITKREYL